jgi:hypothetical protein
MKQHELTKQQLADHWGVDLRTITRYVAAGLPHTGSRRTLRFNVETAERWRAGSVAPHMPWRCMATRNEARRICEQCGDPSGYPLEEADTLESPDPMRFCWPRCASDHAAGKTMATTRREFAAGLLQSGWTRHELKLDGYLGWL